MALRYNDICELKIVVQHSKPSIWRRIQVPGAYNFFELHVAIQDVMNWSGYDLHRFQMKRKYTISEVEYIGINDPVAAKFVRIIPESQTRIADQFSSACNTCIYTYNFVTEFILVITLEKIFEPMFGVKYPCFIAGRRQSLSEYEDVKVSVDVRFSEIHVCFRDPTDVWASYQQF